MAEDTRFYRLMFAVTGNEPLMESLPLVPRIEIVVEKALCVLQLNVTVTSRLPPTGICADVGLTVKAPLPLVMVVSSGRLPVLRMVNVPAACGQDVLPTRCVNVRLDGVTVAESVG